MKALYITSVERYSGKTATSLALGIRFQRDGFKVGYLKPLSLQPWRMSDPETGEMHLADEDAAFVKEVLHLPAKPWEISPVVVTPELLEQQITNPQGVNLMQRVKGTFEETSQGQDVMLLEGGGSLREGYVVGLPTIEVAHALGSQALVIVRYQNEVRLLDNVLAAKTRLGDSICGIILNRVPAEARSFVEKLAIPYIENQGLAVLGVMPELRSLTAISVGELIKVLQAEVLTKDPKTEALVENLTVGAMTAEAALSRFRRYSKKAVITGGDRTDIQLAALETSTTCLILTGNLRPSPLVVKQAEEFGVTMLLVRNNTMETIESIEKVYGKTRLGEQSKLELYQALIQEHLDYDRLKKALGL
jgi:BioD-like phosphotransacetylase family protein